MSLRAWVITVFFLALAVVASYLVGWFVARPRFVPPVHSPVIGPLDLCDREIALRGSTKVSTVVYQIADLFYMNHEQMIHDACACVASGSMSIGDVFYAVTLTRTRSARGADRVLGDRVAARFVDVLAAGGFASWEMCAKSFPDATPLMRAIDYGWEETPRRLVAHGAAVGTVLPSGRDALLVAIEHGTLGSLRIVLEAGADPCAKRFVPGHGRMTPLAFAEMLEARRYKGSTSRRAWIELLKEYAARCPTE